jgi:hypothetical protein
MFLLRYRKLHALGAVREKSYAPSKRSTTLESNKIEEEMINGQERRTQGSDAIAVMPAIKSDPEGLRRFVAMHRYS